MKSILRVFSISIMLLYYMGGEYIASELQTIKIEYSNKVNGYSIKVIWKPLESRGQHIIGPAIIEMSTDDDISFYITNSNFSILKSKLANNFTEDDYGIPNFNKENLILSYDENSIVPSEDCKFGTTNEPFFFQDVDFDGKSELIVSEVGNGQRFYASFKIYKLNNGSLQEELYGITYKKPFISLDEMSEVDYVNKQVTLYQSGGACGSIYEIYKLNEEYGENDLVLDTIIEYEENLGKCYEVTSKVANLSKKVISKKEMK